MAADGLIEIVNKLTAEEQAAVREFVEFLRHRTAPQQGLFLKAIDEFIDEHPELLRRLAQ
ncbi:MAG: hypothetical protein ABSE56_14040 [Bryobacteraceae bacterium]|jgi:phosphoserine phosphatase